MIRKWITSIRAIDPYDGELKTWMGPVIEAISIDDAWNYLEDNGLGYCSIDGELIAEIPCKEDSYEPDFDNTIDYEKIRMN
jgi:hypothetical protein